MVVGVSMVKLEGGDWFVEFISGLRDCGVFVCGYFGLIF